MTTIQVRDANNNIKYLSTTGAGTEGDPFLPVQDVNVQDQTSRLIDLFLLRELDSATLTVDVAVEDKDITFSTTGYTPLDGDILCLRQDGRWFQAVILAVTPNGGDNYTVTVDSPADHVFTVIGHEVCSVGSNNLAVDGSTTSVKFFLSPPANTQWDIVRMLIYMQDATVGDDGNFAGEGALTNGIVLRREDGDFNNIFNFKTNGDLAGRCFDFEYAEKAPAGTFGFRARRTFGGQSKNGVVIRLDGDSTDKFAAIVQDDLTGVDIINIVVQGHVVV